MYRSQLLFLIIIGLTACKKRIWLRKLENCDQNYDYPIKFESSTAILNTVQTVNVTAILNTPFGQDQSMNATVEYSPTGDGYVPMFKFSRSNLCDFLNKDLGAFWFELQQQIAVRQRTCPMLVGRYNLRNYEMPYKKLTIPMPNGFIQTYIYIVEQKTERLISCLYNLMEVTNE